MSIESPPGELTPASLATAILAAKGKTFHWASALLGKRFRQRATRLYGFCRTVDDLADETADRQSGLACPPIQLMATWSS
jgi:phytoene/squalene synthetase